MSNTDKVFYITGLPRSRTAWFAAFMTASGFPCYHEAVIGCKSLKEYQEKVANHSDSTTGLGILDKADDRPTLAITGRVERATEFAGCDKSWMEELEQTQVSMAGMAVHFDEVDDRIEDIFKFLTGQDIDWSVYELFRNLTITTHVEFDYVAF
jgi:hypothetical protein